jgi:hypothetical protein
MARSVLDNVLIDKGSEISVAGAVWMFEQEQSQWRCESKIML